jgi:GGDEF domain-containing protein
MVKTADGTPSKGKDKTAKAGPPGAGAPGGKHPRAGHHHPKGIHSCLDPVTLLYHEEHFLVSLKYEMARSLEAEKPLGLLLINFGEEAEPPLFLSELLERNLRKIDLPSRLRSGEIAIVMPRVNVVRLGKLVEKLGREISGKDKSIKALFGAVILSPNQSSESPEAALRKGRAAYASYEKLSEDLTNLKGSFGAEDTALRSEEKESLYEGFKSLREEKAPVLPPGDSSVKPEEKESLFEAFRVLREAPGNGKT